MKATNGCRLSAPILQVWVATNGGGLHLTRLSPDSASKAEQGQEDHDEALSENRLPRRARSAASSRSAFRRLLAAIASTIRRKILRLWGLEGAE